MLYALKTLMGYPALATDGETGHVRDFLLDDQTWKVRYLVVDVGSWLHRHEVVLPITALEAPDWEKKRCHVRLSRQQIHDSPDVDSEKPVSRQQELAMRDYFGPLACWIDSEFGFATMPTGVRYPAHLAGDAHLRSAAHMMGYRVVATDGEIGELEGLMMDEASWHLGYLDVKAGGWLQNRSVLIPTDWIKSVSWAEFRIFLHHAKAGT